MCTFILLTQGRWGYQWRNNLNKSFRIFHRISPNKAPHLHQIIFSSDTIHWELTAPEDKPQVFHRTILQLLFLITRTRCNINITVALLDMCVKDPDKDNMNKLCHRLWHLKHMINLPLKLEVENIHMLHWLMHVDFMVNKYIKNYTGGR